MLIPLLAGAGFGFGLLCIWRGMFPPPPPLQASLARLANDEGQSLQFAAPSSRFSIFLPLAQNLLGLFELFGLSFSRLRADLAVLDRTIEAHFAEKTALALFGFVLAPATAALMAMGGVQVPIAVPVWVAIILAAVLFFAPDIGVRSEAAEKREEFRHSFGSFLDLVVIGLAGGSGVEGALLDAAETGNNWAIGRIRSALAEARIHGTTPWSALSRLGRELGISELVELGASVSLAGVEGAKVRQSLAAKTESLRSHQLANAEAKAQSASEAMSLPVVLLFAGFLIFTVFPAITRVLTGL